MSRVHNHESKSDRKKVKEETEMLRVSRFFVVRAYNGNTEAEVTAGGGGARLEELARQGSWPKEQRGERRCGGSACEQARSRSRPELDDDIGSVSTTVA